MKEWFNNVYNLGVISNMEPEDKRRAVLINQILFFCGLTPILMLPLVILIAEPFNAVFVLLSGISLGLALLFSMRGKHKLGLYYFTTLVTLILGLATLLFSNSYADLFIIPVATVPFITLKSKREAIAIFILEMLFFLIIMTSNGLFEPLMIFDDTQGTQAYISSVVIIAFMLLVILFKLKEQNERFESDIIKQKELTEEAHNEVVDSIVYARRIQEALLPSKSLIENSLNDGFIFFKPKDVVSGDFYWVEPSKELTLFAAADCTGHGVPGAMVSVVCVNALNRCVREFGLQDPGQILNKTRELVVDTFERSDHDVKDGMDISLCALNKNTMELYWAGANNPLWIVRNGAKVIEETKPDKQPIGKCDNPFLYTTHKFQLAEGDSIYVFTDGYQDQFGGLKGKKFKIKQLRETILNITDKLVVDQRRILDHTFDIWKEDLEQVDDVCVIGVKI